MSPPLLMVLGVAQDGGHPQAGCSAPCCAPAWADPSVGHRASCLGLIDSEGRRFLLDATPDLPAQLQALNQRAGRSGPPDGVLLTHAHVGHYAGLMQLGREVMGARRVPVWAMPRMKRFLESHGPWEQLVRLGNIELRELVPGLPTRLSPELSVTARAVPHRGEYSETVGFVVQGPSKSALYLPDIDAWELLTPSLSSMLQQIDHAFVDGTFYSAEELPERDLALIPHPLVAETMARLDGLSEALKAKLRFIHFNHTNPLLWPGSAQAREVAARGFEVAVEGASEAL